REVLGERRVVLLEPRLLGERRRGQRIELRLACRRQRRREQRVALGAREPASVFGERHAALTHRGEQPRRRRRVRVLERLPLPRERFDITRRVTLEELGDVAEAIDDLEAPRAELARRPAAREREFPPPSLARDGEVARVDLALLVGVDRRAFGEQTVEEQK